MPSRPEIIAAAAHAALAGVTGALVLRGGALPEAVPAAGLVNVVETEPVELAERLGGVREMVLTLDVELAVVVADDAARAAALDALARACATALLGSAGLAAVTEHRRIAPLRDRQDAGVQGAATVRSATLPVELHYSTGVNPLE